MHPILKIGLPAVFLQCGCMGCAALSKTQIEAVSRFSTACDSIAAYPGTFFRELSELRTRNDVYYTASLFTPEVRTEALDALYKASETELRLANKANMGFEVLREYMRALRSLAHENRYSDLFRETRSLGKNLDSLIYRYNDFVPAHPLPTGLGKSAGQIVAAGARIWMRHRQGQQVRYFVGQGDTLVSLLTANLVELLQSEALEAMLENQITTQRRNYLGYLRRFPDSPPEEDRLYLERIEASQNLRDTRNRVVRSARSLRNAHKKLHAALHSRKDYQAFYDELVFMERELKQIHRSLKPFVAL